MRKTVCDMYNSYVLLYYYVPVYMYIEIYSYIYIYIDVCISAYIYEWLDTMCLLVMHMNHVKNKK